MKRFNKEDGALIQASDGELVYFDEVQADGLVVSLEQFKQPDGWYKFDGCDYEETESLLQVGVLGLCGCGSPDENLEYIRGALEIFAERFPKTPHEDRPAWDRWFKEHQERVLAHFGNERSAYFFYYWAAKNDITEHGSSVPGWLTDKGKNLLKLLNENKAGLKVP